MPTPWRWWQKVCWIAGLATIAAALAPYLDDLGQRDVLVAHVAQHLLLGDVAPLLLALGLPPRLRRALAVRLTAIGSSRHRLAAWALSPVGALALWIVVTWAWFVPPLHRAAVPAGPVHLLEHASFLTFGSLLALAIMDPRPLAAPRAALRVGGLPWWGRHVYSMGSRVFMLPPALAVAFSSSYRVSTDRLADGGRDSDRVNAASLLIGFEMVLFALSFVLAFLFLAVAEGKRRGG